MFFFGSKSRAYLGELLKSKPAARAQPAGTKTILPFRRGVILSRKRRCPSAHGGTRPSHIRRPLRGAFL